MRRYPIDLEKFLVAPHARWGKQWLALAAGDFYTGRFNAMTVAWGSFGTMWSKPVAQIVVRPTRYTYQFLEQYDTFTLSGFPAEYRAALDVLGTQSGRNGDKIAAAGLTPSAASQVLAPAFAEADLVLECRKIYWDDMHPEHFLKPELDENYPRKDYHRIYFGEIVAISGESSYSA